MKPGVRLAFFIAGGYLVVSALWIVFSDRLAETMFQDPAALATVQTWKGLAFVLVSALVIGLCIWWYERALARDYDEIKRAELQLKSSEQRFSRFLDHSPLPAWLTDRDGNVLWASKGFREAGLSADPEAILKRRGFAVYRFQADDRGECFGHIAADLGERVRDADELRAELDALVNAVSHDLRAPLRSLTGFSEALREDYGDKLDDEARHFLQRIHDAAEMMGRLIEGLLELSGVSRQQVQRQPVDIAMLARAEVDRLRAGDPHRAVEVKIPASIPVEGDPKLLKQAVQQLISNAWKYTVGYDGARIELSRDGDTIVITDNGAGFDMAYAHKLFTPFQRLHGVGRYSGMGIGLAVTQRIIQRHGGSIWLESKPEQGTVVRFTLG